MPTTLPMALSSARGSCARTDPTVGLTGAFRSNARRLAIDAGQQVRDVVPLEQTLPQRLENLPALVGRSVAYAIPLRAELSQLRLVLRPPLFDRQSRRVEAASKLRRIGARLAQLANLVQLLVQREDRLEQHRRNLRG